MERMRKQTQAAVVNGEPGLVAGGFDAKYPHVVESFDATTEVYGGLRASLSPAKLIS
jgi:hypothetical protein